MLIDLQIWDISAKAKCLVRLRPADISDNQSVFASFEFAPSQVSSFSDQRALGEHLGSRHVRRRIRYLRLC